MDKAKQSTEITIENIDEISNIIIEFANNRINSGDSVKSEEDKLRKNVSAFSNSMESIKSIGESFVELSKCEKEFIAEMVPIIERCYYGAVFHAIVNAFSIGKLAGLSHSAIKTMLEIAREAEAEGRLDLPRAGRAKQQPVLDARREKIEAAINSIGQFAVSEAFAIRAADVVRKATGISITPKSLKSGYLVPMNARKKKSREGAVQATPPKTKV